MLQNMLQMSHFLILFNVHKNLENCQWIPMLLIENSQMQRQTGAAVESFRNEVAAKQPQPVQRLNPIKLAQEQYNLQGVDL